MRFIVDECVATVMREIRSALSGYVFRARSEAEFQAQVVIALGASMPHVTLDTEVRQGGGRFDVTLEFGQADADAANPYGWTGLIVLELKVKSSAAAVERQAQRYALMDGVEGVMVITTSQRLAASLLAPGDLGQAPLPTLGGKPFEVMAVRTS